MVMPGHEPMSVAERDRVMTDRLNAALRELLVGRSVTEAALLLEHFNRCLEACQAEPVAEPMTVH
jgi:hypothetical protein